MVNFKIIDRIVNFDENTENLETEIRAVLKVNDKKIEKIAKDIDKEYYSKKCFGVAFYYVHKEKKIYKLGEENCIYYVDNGGNDNYIEINSEEMLNLQNIIEKEYLKYLENKEKYCKKNKYLFVENI